MNSNLSFFIKTSFSEGLEESLKILQAYCLPLLNVKCIPVKDHHGHQPEVEPPVQVAMMIKQQFTIFIRNDITRRNYHFLFFEVSLLLPIYVREHNHYSNY